MPNNLVFSNPGGTLIKWGDATSTPYLTLSSVPSSGTVGVAVSGVVSNAGSVSATWAISTSPADTLISPSSGTLAAGANVAFTLTALASGLKNVLLTSSTPGVTINGSPMSFTAASVSPPPPPPAPAPSPSGAYRNAQTYLFQPVDSASRPAQIVGAGAYNPDIWGPTNLYVDFQAGWAWTNAGGDWIDSTLTAQGTTPWASVATPTGTAGVIYDQSMTLTTALQNVQTNGRWCAFRMGRSAAARTIAGQFHGDPTKRPYIAVTYTDATTANLACKVSAMIDAGSTAPQSTQAEITLPAFLEFERPTKAVASAVLHFSVTQQQWSGSPTDIKIDGILTPPLNTDPATNTGGLAASSTALDATLAAVPGILGVHRYADSTTLTDYYVDQSTKSKASESNYDPAIWGGAQDLTKWPHTVAGKWMRSNSGDPAPTLVDSSYTGEGFSPLYPGLGALRIHMADQTVVAGQEVTNAGRLAADLLLMLPDANFGTTDRIFVRYYRRIGTPYSPQPADRVQVLSGGTPRWTDMSGKTGIGPSHATTFGGVSGTSGGGYGWQMRHSWYDADLGMGGPDEGGVTQGFHLYDYQSNNPVGHRYGTESEQAERWGQRGGLGAVMYAGRWYEIETELKLNTINIGAGTYSADGELRCWIDGRLVYQRTGMVFRTAPIYTPAYNASQLRPARQLGIKELWLNIFHGGQSENTYPRTDFIAGLAWGTSRIGAMKSPAPAWASGLAADTWTPIAGTNFSDWASAGGIPAGAYRGSNSILAMVDAFCDPATDPATGDQYFFGGGHGDGSCNAVVKQSGSTLQYSLVGQPTPPSVYLPGYMTTGNADVFYPSGVQFGGSTLPNAQGGGWFKTVAVGGLNPVADAAYIPPALAKVASHMYGAAVKRGSVIHYLYSGYSEFDTATGQWGGYGVDLAAQIYAMFPNYMNVPLQSNTMAIYDPVTDRIYCSFIPGDAGASWRSGVLVFNPNTRTVQAVLESNDASYGIFLRATLPVIVGRKLYWFVSSDAAGWTQDRGCIIDLDVAATKTGRVGMDDTYCKKFVLSGSASTNVVNTGQAQETVPAVYDPAQNRIIRWNYSAAERAKVAIVNLTPSSGAGTPASPYVLDQTSRALAGTPPATVNFVYTRMFWDAGAGAIRVLPAANSNIYALKVS